MNTRRGMLRWMFWLTLVALLALPSSSALADSVSSGESASVDTETCLACHATPDLRVTLPSDEVLYLTIDGEAYAQSVHGQIGYGCVQCHTDISGFPHRPLTADSRRDFTLQMYGTCSECHGSEYEHALDDVHQKALAAGDPDAAVCSDCHGSHEVGPAGEPRTRVPQTCEKCHSEVYQLYEESVHGEALLGDGNPEVPHCTDCHEVHGEQHEIEGPSDSPFRLFSPQICADCHADETLMGKYDLSTDVMDTYVSDFHGTTVVLFQELAPDQETNKPVCVDCHGVHDMKSVDDPESYVIKQNLLVTCQRCHPDATADFPDSWTSHYRPSPEHSPLVFFISRFYNWFFIPILIGGMVLFVGTDITRRLINRRKGETHE